MFDDGSKHWLKLLAFSLSQQEQEDDSSRKLMTGN